MKPLTKIYSKSVVTLLLVFFFGSSYAQEGKAYFLHHSTGGGVYNQGNVEDKINAYNQENGTNYQIDEKPYPTNPYPWHNYAYDYWNLWINGVCDNSDPDVECLESMLERYEIIIFKHCYPGSDIVPDIANPSVSSSVKCLANYKLQYRALRDKMANFPNKKFVVWTLAPRHRLYAPAQSAERAARAREFVNWVKNEWLTEEGRGPSNIYIFDFFNIVAESDPNPPNGQVNCLKYEYERSHTGNDSHQNQQANEVAGEAFANFLINNVYGVALPIDINKFEVTITNNNATLIWQTTTEINNEGFYVERSNDGREFKPVGFVEGNGNSSEIINYRFNDNDLPSGVYYYRLKQIDFNGTYKHSEIKTVTVKNSKDRALISFAPNPAQSYTELHIDVNEKTNVNVQIVDITGKLVEVQKFNLDIGKQIVRLDLKDYKQGVYFAKVIVNNRNYMSKLVVK